MLIIVVRLSFFSLLSYRQQLPHLTNQVCGHRAVWVPDGNALWSPYVFGSIPQTKDIHPRPCLRPNLQT